MHAGPVRNAGIQLETEYTRIWGFNLYETTLCYISTQFSDAFTVFGQIHAPHNLYFALNVNW